MTIANRLLQARILALGFDPGPIDGMVGPRTRRALELAQESQGHLGRDFIHASGISRVHIHWTAGAYKPSLTDQKHYHALVDGSGMVHRPHNPGARLAHTLNANTGAIGVSVCAMAGAQERPFDPGRYPIKTVQLASLARVVKGFCRTYDIPVTKYSVLTHAEIEPTLGIKQRGKWDITWLPGMDGPEDPVEVGDRLRTIIGRAIA